jgi:CRP/FNR family transcriptional regulator, cyclic AMP receptor protein
MNEVKATRAVRAGKPTEMVRVLDEDVELARHLSPQARELASTAAIAPLLKLPRGRTTFLIDEPATHGHFGLLVLDGLIARHLSFGQIGSTEFVAHGDLLRPWIKLGDGTEVAQVRWEALTPARLAVLDREFAIRVRPWPELTASLLDRGSQRVNSQLLQAALRQAKRVEDRVLLALWHFAGSWGQVGAEGRIVSLPVTGEVLASIVGARRQSVSTALSALTQRGAIRRRDDGSWVIPDRPPQLARIEAGTRASDSTTEILQTTG